MSTNHTPNYSLSQWERTDKVLMDDFNADNAKIDAALAGKADVQALAELARTVDAKADRTATDGLAQAISDHTAALNRKGNCRVYFSTYTGDGSYTVSKPQTFHFPGKPLFVAIGQVNGNSTLFAFQGTTWGLLSQSMSPTGLIISWSGNSMSISSTSADFHFNAANRTYNIMALIAADS